jgi:glutamate-1-semialdehyde 2,1-aminomutase
VPSNEELFERALARIPGGVNSPVRAFGAVGGHPYFVAKAQGPYVWDGEGRRYIDLVQSYGAIIAGHAHPAIVAAVTEAAALGTSYGAPTEREVMLAEEICRRVRGIEQVRLVNSGTEATMSAIRLARGHTGRSRIVKFAGNYHGHADMLLAAGGSGVATLGLSGSAGVPAGAVADTIVAPYNVVPELDEQVAAVIVEPVAANMGLVAPAPGFLEGLRAECDRVGALLVFDEVITGFRLGPGGAVERYGVQPDLNCFGKVIGGGMPIGAYGGGRQVMASMAPEGPVFQAGTLSGNPVATAAGLAALQLLDDAAYAQLEATADRLAAGLGKGLAGKALVHRVGPLVGLFAGAELPVDYDQARGQDEAAYAAVFHGLLDRGVAMAPGAYEVLFPGLTHTDAVVDEIVAAAEEVGAE